MSEDISDQKPAASVPKPGVLSLAIKEKAALYAAYMPFIKGGGLFIPTNKTYRMGEEVFMLLSLLDDPNKLKVVGNVAWITPVTQGGRPQGIGVQFNPQDGGTEARNKIEALLGGVLKSSRPTHTT
ncbi:pilus assembly protein PilZ [Methylobacillus sp. MM3]|uniref:PilZ domain-containing protein n=1 Tax=Methylobacillus sp. MM3 TaxID=1848039 RepID=UPI0007E22BD6|nr:PilZ domain-containing protein [Methylobacillus sp. MM3]OAJ71521.1 pilus assembly protein PilZ [Methylobacillus sp. MM3]